MFEVQQHEVQIVLRNLLNLLNLLNQLECVLWTSQQEFRNCCTCGYDSIRYPDH